MPKSRKQTPIEDLTNRAEKLELTLKRLEQEIQEILASGEVAPTGCWIVRYQAGMSKRYLLVLQITGI